MAGKVLNKMMGFLGLEDDVELDEIEEVVDENEEDDIETLVTSKKQNKVVSLHTHTNASTKIVIIKPRDYDEAAIICDNLKNKKIVVVNTTGLEARVAQRLLDFIGGACYALSGELQEVEKGVYVVSPSNVEVSNELRSELSNRGILTWSK